MLVVLGVLLFQAKVRIAMAEMRAPLSHRQKLRRYLTAILIWAVMTAGVLFFAFTR